MSSSSRTGPESPRGEPPRRVLVVEDEANQRAMLQRAIEEAGFECLTADSAESALECLDRLQVSLALVDLNLPGRDGLEFIEELSERCPGVQSIILTGYGSLEAAQRAMRLDTVDFLSKPCALDELETALRRAWSRVRPEPAAVRPKSIDDAEREIIDAALARHRGNRAAAAREIGISVRTLYYRIARYAAEDRRRSRGGGDARP